MQDGNKVTTLLEGLVELREHLIRTGVKEKSVVIADIDKQIRNYFNYTVPFNNRRVF